MISLSEKIKAFRKSKGLSQTEFANAVGFSYGYLSEIETGKKPVPKRLLLLIKSVYGIDLTAASQYGKEATTHKLVKESHAEYGYTEEEREYANKLIKIMRTKLEGTVLAIKQNIDALLTTPDKQEETKKNL